MGATAHRVGGSLRTAVLAIGKRVPFVHEAARRTRTEFQRVRYRRLCRSTPVEPRVAIFESYSGRSYSCSPRAICEAMLVDERYSGFELFWALEAGIARALQDRGGYRVLGLEPHHESSDADLDRDFGLDALAALAQVAIVVRGSTEYYRCYARAGVWIANCRIPSHLIPREGQTFVQTWHGTPLKRIGFDMLDPSANPTYSLREWRSQYALEGSRLTYLLAASPFAAKALTSGFDLEASGRSSAVLDLGYPRNDRLKTATAAESDSIRERLGIPEGNRVALYAPTWRDDQHSSVSGYTFEMPLDFERLREQLGEGWTVLFRAHYLTARNFDFARFGGFVCDASSVNDINDLYLVSDMLVTDYSSGLFDYANLLRPILFFMYDLDRYAGEIHGFYLGLEELPGSILRTQHELAGAMIEAAEHPDECQRQLKRFVRTYAPNDDGHASERVLDVLSTGHALPATAAPSIESAQ